MENRHTVVSRGDSPFRVVFFKAGHKNLFSPYLAKGLSRIKEPGFAQMWDNLKFVPDALRNKRLWLSRGKYFEVVQDLFGNVKEPVTFHESNPISLNLMLPVFSLCAAIMAFGLSVFMAERF